MIFKTIVISLIKPWCIGRFNDAWKAWKDAFLTVIKTKKLVEASVAKNVYFNAFLEEAYVAVKVI